MCLACAEPTRTSTVAHTPLCAFVECGLMLLQTPPSTPQLPIPALDPPLPEGQVDGARPLRTPAERCAPRGCHHADHDSATFSPFGAEMPKRGRKLSGAECAAARRHTLDHEAQWALGSPWTMCPRSLCDSACACDDFPAPQIPFRSSPWLHLHAPYMYLSLEWSA